MITRVLIGTGVLIVALIVGLVVWGQSQKAGVPADELEARYVTADDRFVSVDGRRVRVRELGDATAPAIILIHGFSYSLETWNGWGAGLADEFRVIAVDLPGHGLTGPDPQARYTVDDLAQFVGEAMDALGVERASLVGNSLGGLAAWRFAASAPERVDRLVLIAPGGYSINGVTDEPVEVPDVMKFYLTTAPEALVAQFAAAVYGDPTKLDPERTAQKRDMIRRAGNGDALVNVLEVFTLPDPTADLARVSAPTLVLWGDKDVAVPPEHGDRFIADMPNARLVRYPDLGHIPQEEAPAQTLADARAFLLE